MLIPDVGRECGTMRVTVTFIIEPHLIVNDVEENEIEENDVRVRVFALEDLLGVRNDYRPTKETASCAPNVVRKLRPRQWWILKRRDLQFIRTIVMNILKSIRHFLPCIRIQNIS